MKKFILVAAMVCFATLSFTHDTKSPRTGSLNDFSFEEYMNKINAVSYDSAKEIKEFKRIIETYKNENNSLKKINAEQEPQSDINKGKSLPDWAWDEYVRDLVESLPDLKTEVEKRVSRNKFFVVIECNVDGQLYNEDKKAYTSFIVKCFDTSIVNGSQIKSLLPFWKERYTKKELEPFFKLHPQPAKDSSRK